MQIFVRDRAFYQHLAAIAIPIALQNLITVSVTMADTLMLGMLGEVQLSAASIANQFSYMLMVVGFGLSGGANVLMAQYWGKGNVEQIRRIMALVYRLTLIISGCFSFLAIFMPQAVMSVFTADGAVIGEGVRYLRLMGLFYPLYSLSNNSILMFRSVGKVNISLFVYSVSLLVNVFFNWVFIFGNLGAPALGVVGAALGTGIARLTEFAIVFTFVFRRDQSIGFRPRHLRLRDRSISRDFLANASPIVLNELLWSTGTSMVIMVIGHMGREFVSANSINAVVMQLSSVAIMGVSNASAAIIGNTIGGGDLEMAQQRARTLLALSILVGLAAGSLVYFSRTFVIELYNVSALTKAYTYQIMLVGSVLVFFQSLAMVSMIGILRGGGDGRFVLGLDLFFMWTVAIPLGYFAGLRWGWPVPLVYFILRCDDMLKCFFSFRRILCGKWIRDVTR